MALSQETLRSSGRRIGSVINKQVPVEQETTEEQSSEQVIEQNREQLESIKELLTGTSQQELRTSSRQDIQSRKELSNILKDIKVQESSFESQVSQLFPEYAKESYKQESINKAMNEIQSIIDKYENKIDRYDEKYDKYKSKGDKDRAEDYKQKIDEAEDYVSEYKKALNMLKSGNVNTALKEYYSGYTKSKAQYQKEVTRAEYDAQENYIKQLESQIKNIDSAAKIIYNKNGIPIGVESPKYQQTLSLEELNKKIQKIEVDTPELVDTNPLFKGLLNIPFFTETNKITELQIKNIDPAAKIIYNEKGTPIGVESPKYQQTLSLEGLNEKIKGTVTTTEIEQARKEFNLTNKEIDAILNYQDIVGVKLSAGQLNKENIIKIVAYINQNKTLKIGGIDSSIAYDIKYNPLGVLTTSGLGTIGMIASKKITQELPIDKREELMRQQIESLDTSANLLSAVTKLGAVVSGSAIAGGVSVAVGEAGKTLLTSAPTTFLTEEQREKYRKELYKDLTKSAGVGFLHGALLGTRLTSGGIKETYGKIGTVSGIEKARAVGKAVFSTIFDIDKATGVIGSLDDYKTFAKVQENLANKEAKAYSEGNILKGVGVSAGRTVTGIMLPESQTENIFDLTFAGLGQYTSPNIFKQNLAKITQTGVGIGIAGLGISRAEVPSDYALASIGLIGVGTGLSDIKLSKNKIKDSEIDIKNIEGVSRKTLEFIGDKNIIRDIDEDIKFTSEEKDITNIQIQKEKNKIITQLAEQSVSIVYPKIRNDIDIETFQKGIGKITTESKRGKEKIAGFLIQKGYGKGDEGAIILQSFLFNKPLKVTKIKSDTDVRVDTDFYKIKSSKEKKVYTDEGFLSLKQSEQVSEFKPEETAKIKYEDIPFNLIFDIKDKMFIKDKLKELESFPTKALKKDKFLTLKEYKPIEYKRINIGIDDYNKAIFSTKYKTKTNVFPVIEKTNQYKPDTRIVKGFDEDVKYSFDKIDKPIIKNKPIDKISTKPMIDKRVKMLDESEYAFGGAKYKETLTPFISEPIAIKLPPSIIASKIQNALKSNDLLIKNNMKEILSIKSILGEKTLLMTDIKIDTKLDTKIDTKLDTKIDTKLDTKIDTKLDTKIDTKIDTKLDTKIDTKLDTKIDTKLDTKIDTKIDTKLDTKLKDIMNNKKINGGRIPTLSLSPKKEYYIPEAKRNDKWVKLSEKGMSEKSALSRGARAVDNTVAVSFRIKKVKEGDDKIIDNYYSGNINKFRDYKIRNKQQIPLKNEFIELKGKERIDTSGEKKGLTLAKYIKQQGWAGSSASRKLNKLESRYKIPTGI